MSIRFVCGTLHPGIIRRMSIELFVWHTAEVVQDNAEDRPMEHRETPYVVSADRINGSIIVAFEDGRCGVYSAELLYEMLPRAREFRDEPEPDQQTARE